MEKNAKHQPHQPVRHAAWTLDIMYQDAEPTCPLDHTDCTKPTDATPHPTPPGHTDFKTTSHPDITNYSKRAEDCPTALLLLDTRLM